MLRTGRISENDLKEVAVLEAEIFSDAWSRKGLAETLEQPGAVIFGVWEDEMLAGYVILYFVLDEGEIERIAVRKALRRRGAARMLFECVLEFCREKRIERLFLEVRRSNVAAQAFYRRCGFQENGIRKNFYTNPSEDAILYIWN